jgi:hypothetical protein
MDMSKVEGEKHRPSIKMMPVHERILCFAQVALGYNPEKAIEETQRCLRCDLEKREDD